jgi:hypothetical protein
VLADVHGQSGNRTDLYYLAAWDRATIDPGRVWRISAGLKF